MIYNDKTMVSNNTIRRIIREELTKSDAEMIAKQRVDSFATSSDFKKKVREITADVIEDFVKVLWQRSSSWKGGIR